MGILAMDWNSLMEKFRQTCSPDLCENELPAQSYFEEFEECLAEGRLEVERLPDVVSDEEAQGQRKMKADLARQYGIESRNLPTKNNSEQKTPSCRTCGFSCSSVSREGPFTGSHP